MNVTHTESTRGHVGQGLYSLGELRLYVAHQGDKDDARHVFRWLTAVLNPVGHRPRRPDYSFADLVSLFVVRELLRHGVAPAAIREAERYLRSVLDLDRPFVSERIQTDGRNVFYGSLLAGEAPESIEAANLQGQRAMVEPIRAYLTSVSYEDEVARRWHPVEQVVLDPEIQFGDPVIEGTRVLTATVAEAAARVGDERAAETFDVDLSAARSAIRFERRLASLGK